MIVTLTRLSVTSALLGALILPVAAHAQSTTRSTAQERPAGQLSSVLEQLEGIIAQLAIRETLSEQQTEALRRQLVGVYQELERLQTRLDGNVLLPALGSVPPQGGTGQTENPATSVEDNRSGVWTRFGNATVNVRPANARFTGWAEGNDVKLSYGDGGEILLTVQNGGYTADWRLRKAYTGSVRITMRTSSGGNIELEVNDARGQHEFLVKDGGIGPIYVRGMTVPEEAPFTGGAAPASPAEPTGSNSTIAGVWFRPYQDGVRRGEVATSSAMDWLIAQYEGNSFASVRLRELGVLLSELEGAPLQSRVARMRYIQGGQEVTLDFPDPRAKPGEFAAALSVLRDLQLANRWYELELSN